MAALGGVRDESDPQGAALAACAVNTMEYFDVLLLGKTGKGKSTTGNKLLGKTLAAMTACTPRSQPKSRSRSWSWPRKAICEMTRDTIKGTENLRRRLQVIPAEAHIKVWPNNFQNVDALGALGIQLDEKKAERSTPFFALSEEHDIGSTTRECKLLSNEETKVRVLDCPGFADSDSMRMNRLGLYQANLQTMRLIVGYDLSYDRILYFLPERGAQKKADRAIQEEVKVMVHFFGAKIFYNMVIIATLDANDVRDYKVQFTPEKAERTRRTFSQVMQMVLAEENLPINVECPPVCYIAFEDSPKEVLDKVQAATVRGEPRQQAHRLLAGARATHGRRRSKTDVTTAPAPKPEKGKAIHLQFRNVICTKCGVKTEIINENKVKVVEQDGETIIPYNDSYCHPVICQQFSQSEKVIGGFVHIATMGLVYIVFDKFCKTKSWPSFTTSEEICPVCFRKPGPGCTQVLATCKIRQKNGESIEIQCDHNSKL